MLSKLFAFSCLLAGAYLVLPAPMKADLAAYISNQSNATLEDEKFVDNWGSQFEGTRVFHTCPGDEPHYFCFYKKATALVNEHPLVITAYNRLVKVGMNVIASDKDIIKRRQYDSAILDSAFQAMHLLLWALPVVQNYDVQTQAEARDRAQSLKGYLTAFTWFAGETNVALSYAPSTQYGSYRSQLAAYSTQFRSYYGQLAAQTNPASRGYSQASRIPATN